jgi:integrase
MAKTSTKDATKREVSRTSDTEAQYRKKGHRLISRARHKTGKPGLDLHGCLEWYSKHNRRRYTAASLRFHRQAWLCIINDAVVAGEITLAEADTLRADLHTKGPERKGRFAAKKTSAKKVKDATKEEVNTVAEYLLLKKKADPRDRAASALLVINSFLGLRPIEWRGVNLKDDVLHVPSAKTTNGRGLVEIRPIRLVSWGSKARGQIQFLVDYLQEWATQSREAFLAEMDRLRQRIAHACRKTGTRRLCVYGTRHTCIATLRRLGVAPAEIAAQVGHGTVRTHTRHYARSQAGWPLTAARTMPADQDIVKMVRTHPPFSLDRVRPEPGGSFGLR